MAQPQERKTPGAADTFLIAIILLISPLNCIISLVKEFHECMRENYHLASADHPPPSCLCNKLRGLYP